MRWISKVEMKRKTIFSLVLLLILMKSKDCKGKRESYSKSNLVFYVYERFFVGLFNAHTFATSLSSCLSTDK